MSKPEERATATSTSKTSRIKDVTDIGSFISTESTTAPSNVATIEPNNGVLTPPHSPLAPSTDTVAETATTTRDVSTVNLLLNEEHGSGRHPKSQSSQQQQRELSRQSSSGTFSAKSRRSSRVTASLAQHSAASLAQHSSSKAGKASGGKHSKQQRAPNDAHNLNDIQVLTSNFKLAKSESRASSDSASMNSINQAPTTTAAAGSHIAMEPASSDHSQTGVVVRDPVMIRGAGNITIFGICNKFNEAFPSPLNSKLAPEEFKDTMRQINGILSQELENSLKWLVLGSLFCCCTLGCSFLPVVYMNKKANSHIEKFLEVENQRLYLRLGLRWRLTKIKCSNSNSLLEYVLLIDFLPNVLLYQPD